MRLSESQQQAIRETVLAEDPTASVYLFGSRTDDRQEGGDIDLYLETDIETGTLELKARLLNRLWERLGPQRIDLLLHRRGTPFSPFEREIHHSGIRL
ncbi:nucleotidyltransferase domain-containing protein [Thiohalomonas denitrificans]|uniref:nucleotidyltransferase domain-containing protein n=1 Tax=Thiohalomonas denitrificans TaxID=415747 RepID=UPI0026F2EE54|nr:nucleotidyltransferase domain-containing protein [Thiohalomonas denitrificans]